MCKYSEPFPTWFSEEVSGDGGVSLVKPEMHQNSSSDFLQQNEALEVLAEGENLFPINLNDAFSTAGLGCAKAEILQPSLLQLSYRT